MKKTLESLVAELTENLKRATIEEKRECLNEVDLDRASIEAIWEIFQQPRRVVDHHDAPELDAKSEPGFYSPGGMS